MAPDIDIQTVLPREAIPSTDDPAFGRSTGGSDDGRRLTPVPARRLFAFAWQDAYGPDAFYRGEYANE